jgi:hypothetical protein
MEPGGCNRQQSAADRANLKTVRTSQIRATSCHRLPKTFHGKEGVDGSSPSEGSAKAPHTGLFVSG